MTINIGIAKDNSRNFLYKLLLAILVIYSTTELIDILIEHRKFMGVMQISS